MEDHARRREGIGGSDMAAILGASKTYRSAFEIWQVKTGRTVEAEEDKPLDLFEVGNVFEAAVCLYGERIAIELGAGEDPPGHQPDFSRHPDYPIQGHIDHRVGSAIVEGKVIVHGVAPPGKVQWEMQCRTYMALPAGEGCTFAVVAMLDIPAKLPAEAIGMAQRHADDPVSMLAALEAVKWARFTHVVYERRDDMEAAMLEAAGEWWERHVVGDEPPPVDGSRGARDWLLEEHPGPPKEERTIRKADELEALVRKYADAAAREKAAAAEKAQLGQELMKQIGDDYGVRGFGWTATWSRWTKRATDWNRARQEAPELLEALEAFKTDEPAGRITVRFKK